MCRQDASIEPETQGELLPQAGLLCLLASARTSLDKCTDASCPLESWVTGLEMSNAGRAAFLLEESGENPCLCVFSFHRHQGPWLGSSSSSPSDNLLLPSSHWLLFLLFLPPQKTLGMMLGTVSSSLGHCLLGGYPGTAAPLGFQP